MTIILILLAVLALVVAALVQFTRATARKVEAVVPPLGRIIDVAGTRLHVHEEGEGQPLLLVHGLGGQVRNFSHSLTAQLRNRYRVVLVDRPGSGYSPRADGAPADLATQARTLAALIDHLRLEKPVVVGHSLGGALALRLALDFPDKVGGLALLAPLTHLPAEPKVADAFKGLTIANGVVRTAVAYTLATPMSIALGQKVLGQIFAPDPVPRDFRTKGGGLLTLRPAPFLGASADLQALPAAMPDQMARYADLRLPVGVLYGSGDAILDWRENGQALVRLIPGSTLEVIEGGHMLPVVYPQQCAQLIDTVAQRVAAETNA
ncbi:alpha/beta hydrolase [Massilia arenosa]|uniref:Alpha/beta hydrolase n=1 Tax=Zemynaea arenosa TaxID=2561931 RepID=A0A4Y9SBZ7_9BURK|nr:alpha/beta hydrolase [Massilia arenosa]TFW19959.1 alpha/beta hydrolase [Massilia arenosa]